MAGPGEVGKGPGRAPRGLPLTLVVPRAGPPGPAGIFPALCRGRLLQATPTGAEDQPRGAGDGPRRVRGGMAAQRAPRAHHSLRPQPRRCGREHWTGSERRAVGHGRAGSLRAK